MAKILVVDDERVLLDTLRYNLVKAGYEVRTAADGDEALSVARKERPDLLILDVMLPKMDGFEVCRTLRRESSVPILMLTARDEELDRVLGLELGADDYIAKPFSMRELLARVKATLRRVDMGRADSTPEPAPTLKEGDLELDLSAHLATFAGKPLHMKPKEYDLLAFLMRSRGRAFSRDQLLEQVWGYDYAGDTRTVDVHVRWLREKVESDPSQPELIETVRGVGYRFKA
ncbi:MAG TPA: response regulator transcription factor [Chloroflexota bacterium]|nr:response regulator transcription factor [Chloroflexota bacterium]